MSARPRVVVVGGGIAGLATAWLVRMRAAQASLPIELEVLEAEPGAGGYTRSERIDGFLCEIGPNGFLDNEPRTLELVSLLGLEPRLARARPESAHRFIYRGGKLREVPAKPLAFALSDVLPLSVKLRVLLEPFVPARRDGADESVFDFGKRRLGERFAEYLLQPMVSGIFAGDARSLSLASAFPKMAELEATYGGLFRALAAKSVAALRQGGSKNRGGPAGPAGALHTFVDGMGELTGKLAADLAAELRTGTRVLGLRRDGRLFQVELEGSVREADAVVLACPAPAAAGIVASLDERTAAALAAIPYAAVAVACRGYRLEDLGRPLDGFGVLVTRGEAVKSLGALCSDRIFEGQAPEGSRLLRVLVGGAHDPSIADAGPEELDGIVRHDLDALFGASGTPACRRDWIHREAIAQYTLGHGERVAESVRLEGAVPGVYFTGASYRGVSVNGCVKDAFGVSERLVRMLCDRTEGAAARDRA